MNQAKRWQVEKSSGLLLSLTKPLGWYSVWGLQKQEWVPVSLFTPLHLYLGLLGEVQVYFSFDSLFLKVGGPNHVEGGWSKICTQRSWESQVSWAGCMCVVNVCHMPAGGHGRLSAPRHNMALASDRGWACREGLPLPWLNAKYAFGAMGGQFLLKERLTVIINPLLLWEMNWGIPNPTGLQCVVFLVVRQLFWN